MSTSTIRIPLTRGQSALVDLIDYETIPLLRSARWYARRDHRSGNYYAVRSERLSNGKRIQLLMHRLITGAVGGEEVDHLNHNTLDNRCANLVRCSHAANTKRKKKRMRGSSQFKGVRRQPGRSWQARICNDGVSFFIGAFATELEAAKAYDAKARELWGKNAVVNFLEVE